jgi:PadR family transcriptional regulator PadR
MSGVVMSDPKQIRGKGRGRQGRGGRMMLQPSLLLLLAEGDCHGYDLYDQLADFGFNPDCLDQSIVYRHLRGMEKRGFIQSYWDEDSKGPRKRVYQIIKAGYVELEGWIKSLGRQQERINTLIKKYQILDLKEE